MKRCYFLLLAIALSGCVLPTGPEPSQHVREESNFYAWDLFRSPLPKALYDGIFTSTMYVQEYIDSSGKDTTSVAYVSQPRLFNRLGDNIVSILYSDSVELDNVLYSHDPALDLNFPGAVTWSMKGDSYFPAFSHTINSEPVPSILAPSLQDSLNADSMINLTYDAPSADTLTTNADYIGEAHWLKDPPDSLSLGVESHEYISANTGSVKLLPFSLDTTFYTSFRPELLAVNIAWARGDTIHVGGKIFGFVTEVSCSREYYLK